MTCLDKVVYVYFSKCVRVRVRVCVCVYLCMSCSYFETQEVSSGSQTLLSCLSVVMPYPNICYPPLPLSSSPLLYSLAHFFPSPSLLSPFCPLITLSPFLSPLSSFLPLLYSSPLSPPSLDGLLGSVGVLVTVYRGNPSGIGKRCHTLAVMRGDIKNITAMAPGLS